MIEEFLKNYNDLLNEVLKTDILAKVAKLYSKMKEELMAEGFSEATANLILIHQGTSIKSS